jgi:hypothetical protein
MCVTRAMPFLLLGVLLALVGSDSAFPQPAGGERALVAAADRFFNRFSGGKDEVDMATAVLPARTRANWLGFLQRQGIRNGKMTRDLFHQFYLPYLRSLQAKKGGKAPPAAAPAGAPAATIPLVDQYFNLFGRGREEFDIETVPIPASAQRLETPEQKRARWRAFLRSRGVSDSRMTRVLYRELYYETVRSQQAQGGKAATPQPARKDRPAAPQPAEGRPRVYRKGRMPKGLPPWFEQLDRDGDAQVGLYEWKAAGRPVDDFVAMDLNGDGFLTAEEVLRYQKAQKRP